MFVVVDFVWVFVFGGVVYVFEFGVCFDDVVVEVLGYEGREFLCLIVVVVVIL